MNSNMEVKDGGDVEVKRRTEEADEQGHRHRLEPEEEAGFGNGYADGEGGPRTRPGKRYSCLAMLIISAVIAGMFGVGNDTIPNGADPGEMGIEIGELVPPSIDDVGSIDSDNPVGEGSKGTETVEREKPGYLVSPENFDLEHERKRLRSNRTFLGVFLHIHKGGGTSLSHLSQKNGERSPSGNANMGALGQRYNLCRGSLEQQEAVYKRSLGKFSFIGNEWTLANELYDSSLIRLVTILRNPLARSESHFSMANEQLEQRIRQSSTPRPVANCLYQEWMSKKSSMSPLKKRIFWVKHTPDNWQVRALCGFDCAKVPFGKLTEIHLKRAKNNLKRYFSAVGILENFPETIALIGRVLQWASRPPRGIGIHAGTSHHSLEFIQRIASNADETDDSSIVTELFKWYNAVNMLDLQLYNFGILLFQEQTEKHGIIVDHPPQPLSLMTPEHIDVGTHSSLQQMMNDYVESENCTTTCCSSECAPIGFYWEATARVLGLLPKPIHCSESLKQSIKIWDESGNPFFPTRNHRNRKRPRKRMPVGKP